MKVSLVFAIAFVALAAIVHGQTNNNTQDTARTAVRDRMYQAAIRSFNESRDAVMKQSAAALAVLQQSGSEQVRTAVDAALAAQREYARDSSGGMRAEFLAALRKALVADSISLTQSTALFANRAITLQSYNRIVGAARAAAIIAASQDTTRAGVSRRNSTQDPFFPPTSSAGVQMGEPLRGYEEFSMTPLEQRLQNQLKSLEALLWVKPDVGSLPSASLGLGLLCTKCSKQIVGQSQVWTFDVFPVVGAVENGSIAERLGLRQGDTLKTVDDVALTSREGGRRLAQLAPGKTVKLGWTRDGVTHIASIVPTARNASEGWTPRVSQQVGNTSVEVFGAAASWTRDPKTGALRITGDSITVIVRPPRD